MWSGRYVSSCEAWNNYTGLSPDDSTFLNPIEKSGYRTHVIGKTDYISEGHSWHGQIKTWLREVGLEGPQKPGPKTRYAVEASETVRCSKQDWDRVDEAVDWLRGQAGNGTDPFFLSVGLKKPHPSFVTSSHWLRKIDAGRVSLPPVEKSSHPVMEYMRQAKGCAEAMAPEEIRLIRRIYYAMIAEVDAMVAEILAAVEEADLAPSTCIIFMSDHGEMNMEHGQYLKNSLYESSVRVPLIVTGPDVHRDLVVERPVSLVDLFPTLMDLSGSSHPDDLEGTSLMPELRGLSGGTPDWVFSEYHSSFQNTGSFMFRTEKWKYIVYAGYEPQLFDLNEDPDEITDLARKRPEVAATLDEKLRDVVDYEEVDARAKRADRRKFRRWRESVSRDEYRKQLYATIHGYGEDFEARIQAWLGGSMRP